MHNGEVCVCVCVCAYERACLVWVCAHMQSSMPVCLYFFSWMGLKDTVKQESLAWHLYLRVGGGNTRSHSYGIVHIDAEKQHQMCSRECIMGRCVCVCVCAYVHAWLVWVCACMQSSVVKGTSAKMKEPVCEWWETVHCHRPEMVHWEVCDGVSVCAARCWWLSMVKTAI